METEENKKNLRTSLMILLVSLILLSLLIAFCDYLNSTLVVVSAILLIAGVITGLVASINDYIFCKIKF